MLVGLSRQNRSSPKQQCFPSEWVRSGLVLVLVWLLGRVLLGLVLVPTWRRVNLQLPIAFADVSLPLLAF